MSVIEREAARIITLSEAAGLGEPDQPVPSCPGWTLQDVPAHVGRVYAMVATVLQGDPRDPPDREQIPSRPDGQLSADWMRERLAILLPMLRDVPEDSQCWNFAEGPSSPVAFWWRRQAHETLIHRVDVELAAGEPVTAAEPEVAADGIGDFLTVTGFKPVDWDEIRLGEGMTVHLHATDADAEWTIDTANHTYAVAHLKADVALRGEVWALDRWCWRRDGLSAREADLLESFGDRQAADDWRPAI